jgi:tRNA (guanine-N7-)-methyltransferase
MTPNPPDVVSLSVGKANADARTAKHFAHTERRRLALGERVRALVPPGSSLDWEIGCGHGHFLTAYAKAHPKRLCIGIDLVRDRIERAVRKANRARLPELHFLLAEAREFLSLLPVGAALSSVYVLFPDPWPKRRHHKNRLMQSAFLNSLAERAGERTRLFFRSDFEPYFAEVSAVIAAHPYWELVDEEWPFETETVFQARAATYSSLVARLRPGTHKRSEGISRVN